MRNWLRISILLGIVGITSCDGNLLSPFKTKGTEATLGKCEPDRPISLTEDTNLERGFFNPKDSLYYSTVIYGIFYRGGETNPCELIRRPYEYKNVISRKFKIIWEGPKGETDRQIPRASIRFTDKNYQDDVDRNLPLADTLQPFPYEIQVKEDSSYVNIITNRDYKVALRKGYSGELNQVKCAEVSLSATKSFDTKRIVLENANATSWSSRYFFKATDFTPDVQYIVVREKECAVCDMPIPTLTAAQTTVSKGQNVVLSFSGCPVVNGVQGPLEWFAQPSGGQKYVAQRFSYSARNERIFQPEVTTTYFLRCQGDWYCKPQKEVSVTIEVR
ncbi:MAG: hypothetical protein R2822_15820 [Spirosomataceae bacterium]